MSLKNNGERISLDLVEGAKLRLLAMLQTPAVLDQIKQKIEADQVDSAKLIELESILRAILKQAETVIKIDEADDLKINQAICALTIARVKESPKSLEKLVDLISVTFKDTGLKLPQLGQQSTNQKLPIIVNEELATSMHSVDFVIDGNEYRVQVLASSRIVVILKKYIDPSGEDAMHGKFIPDVF